MATTNGNSSAQRVWADSDATHEEAWGASQIGPFDYVPRLGFREYWYPALWAKEVGKRKPKLVTMLGEDIVFFRDRDGSIAALTDWCPHRNARFSLGISEFPGTITCPYHGYTFDGTGQCVAGLIDHPESPVIAKMRARKYPTTEFKGIVFAWMGETDPVPLEEDLPFELSDPRNSFYTRVKSWETNWTEPVNQGMDFHEGYLHRMQFKWLPMYPKEPIWARWLMNLYRTVGRDFRFFRPKIAYYGGVRIVIEDEKYFCANPREPVFGRAFHPGVNAKWPEHTWWRVLKRPLTRQFQGNQTSLLGTAPFQHGAQLPSIIRTGSGSERHSLHMRWMVPVNADLTRVWTFTPGRRPKTVPARLFKNLWYYFYRKPNIVIATNEQEDLATFMANRLRFDLPQKLGPLDSGVIYFRRHLARRSRDFQRLGGAKGTDKGLPTRTPEEWASSLPVGATEAAVG